MNKKKFIYIVVFAFIFALAIFTSATIKSLRPIIDNFDNVVSTGDNFQITDRYGTEINISDDGWNRFSNKTLSEIPDFMKYAFIISEDKRFYDHNGVDWKARLSALSLNIRNLKSLRGASTISEQVVRMIHPRKRSIWSRWIEGIEANILENHYSKHDIFAFYLNQVPYASNKRGVSQAANFYFDRDINTLSKKEILALVVLIRAPSRFDLWKDKHKINRLINSLALKIAKYNLLSLRELEVIENENFELKKYKQNVYAPEFVNIVKNHPLRDVVKSTNIQTSLDGNLQNKVQKLLDERLLMLKDKKINNGAVLIIDHTTNEILAYVVGGKNNQNIKARQYDAIQIPRQPGSALKPFIYALALEKGWSAATIIEDAPLKEMVGHGIHNYKNFSNQFYGNVTLREALGNSLNIPAIKALHYVSLDDYYDLLQNIGFTSLKKNQDFYGYGLALGNGEVNLFELVQAYSIFANKGYLRPLNIFHNISDFMPREKIFSFETTSIISDILSDNNARKIEFGEHSILNFPIQTAIKTGTSNDFRDSWAIGFNHRYLVGIWMGSLDYNVSDGITGTIGPGMLLRSVFSILNFNDDTKPLSFSNKLVAYNLCADSNVIKQPDDNCNSYVEYFADGNLPQNILEKEKEAAEVKMITPTNGLHIAIDPKIPLAKQAFEFIISGTDKNDVIIWEIDGKEYKTKDTSFLWYLSKGRHVVSAKVISKDNEITALKERYFVVK